MDNLAVLCPTCHRIADRITKAWYRQTSDRLSKFLLIQKVGKVFSIGVGAGMD